MARGRARQRAGAGAATRWLLVGCGPTVEGEEPPGNPAAPGTTWPAALTWALASGAALAVARLVAQRGAAEAWKTATGSYPAGLEESTALSAGHRALYLSGARRAERQV